ncbi:MAG: 50S ribosomal protein L9 [Alphaproteobacteria bacterium]|nr:50S ribosomal protein L9 [Alphaproteobacteria bacterium]
MEVVLLERIEKLGQMGDVVRVKPGFARNFLLPQKKALRASKENLEYFKLQRIQLEAVNLKRREEAEAVAAKMKGISVVIVRQAGESGQLYGSVAARDLADAVKAQGYTIQRSQVQLVQPIKTLGQHQVRVALHPEVVVTIGVNVARSQDEAKAAADQLESAEKAAVTEAAEVEAEAAVIEE